MPPKVISPRRAVAIEALLFLAYCFFSASWMVGSIVTTDMCHEFGLSSLPSSVNNAISAAKILGNFVAAWILIKLGPKKTVSVSCLLICAVVAGAFATNLSFFVVTRFLLGFGGALLMICMTPYVVYCFEPRRHPIWIGINNAGPNTGNLIALLSVSAVRAWLGDWRSVLIFYGAFSVVFLVLWLIVGRDYPLAPKAASDEKAPQLYRYRDGLKEPFLYKFLFTMTGRLVMYTVMLYLFPLNPDFTVNSQFISLMIALTGIPGTIIGIILAKKLKRQLSLFRFSGVAQSFLFFLMILTDSPTIATVSAILLGFVIFISTPSLFTLPTKLPGATPEKVAVILTLYWAGAYTLQMIVYAVVVHMVNSLGWYLAMLFTALYSLTFLIGTFLLPDFDKPGGTEEDPAT
ncbi:MAG: MFS transporter [Clostridiales bacterium]|uniref:MFS transporter n=1 Tax=Evtepia sp. TaxID=2773933 RepID=UPI0029855400|nr:MFS transporter [Evtepia sp.]MDD7288829.1 MFS transporter [Clostridiales bacterium]MDY4429451.1 MFS transporter [Evtepia sp.]